MTSGASPAVGIGPLHETMTVHRAGDPEQLAEEIAGFVVNRLSAEIAARGRAVLAVSGGRSPQALLERLACADLPWARVAVLLVDERAVGARHPLSNTSSIRSWLLRERAVQADLRVFVPDHGEVVNDLEALVTAAQTCVLGLPAITVAILGMGTDGHFASIFPQMRARDEALSPEAAPGYQASRLLPPPPEAPVDRVTMNLAWLLGAQALVLPVAGEAKFAALKRGLALASPDWPISIVLHQRRAPLHLWLQTR